MKLLVGSWPAYGHLLPMLPMVRAAQAAGHDVVVSTGADMAGLLGRLRIRHHVSGVTLAESYARMPGEQQVSEMPPEEQPVFAARHLFGAGARDRARDVAELMDTWRPDLVVHDTLELGSPTAAVVHGVPHVTHGYGPTVPGSAMFAAGIGTAVAEGGLPDPAEPVLGAPYLDVCPPSLRGAQPEPWADIRPVRPSPGEVLDDDPPVELAGLPHEGTVYVTLGTIMNQAAHVFRAVVDGCQAHDVNLVVTTGPGLEASALGELPASVRTAPYLPQAALLPHCTAVVSHAGAGTMLGALCHGLPQLCLPQGTDQPFNTAALLPTGAALALQPDEVTSEAVADALGRLLDDPSFRAAAGRLQTEIDQMPTADDVLVDLLTRADATA
jgi:UDP:flavonoid glycosyltransferase YjiC (YdhE family)